MFNINIILLYKKYYYHIDKIKYYSKFILKSPSNPYPIVMLDKKINDMNMISHVLKKTIRNHL